MLTNCFYFSLWARQLHPDMELRARPSRYKVFPHFYLENEYYILEVMPFYKNILINALSFILLFGCFPTEVLYKKKIIYD